MAVAKVHHINCGTMLPLGHQLPGLLPAQLVAHVLVVETIDRLVLVDSGFGLADIRERSARLGRPFTTMVNPALIEAECAVRQLPTLGYDAQDVTDIVLTHLDLDHAGGISDFPNATIHVSNTEWDAARNPRTVEQARYVQAQWAHGPRWSSHDLDHGGEPWLGFESVNVIDSDIVMIGLAGHTRGHAGVGILTDKGWLLHAGDAYMSSGDTARPRVCPPGLRTFQRLMAVNNARRLGNLERLADLRASGRARIFSAHDQAEFETLRHS